jgi:hypothetical protein
LGNAFGTQAYSVSPSGAKKLISGCLPFRKRAIKFVQPGVSFWDEGIDGPMNAVYPEMNAYVCVPPLAVQDRNLELSDRKTADALPAK